jgi:PAS domain S-box-containing protein
MAIQMLAKAPLADPQLARTQLAEGLPALKLFEALARLYEHVLVMSPRGRIVWLSPAFESLSAGGSVIGGDARALIPGLPRPEQASSARAELRRRGYLANAPLEVSCGGDRRLPVEVSVFPLAAREADEGPLFVVIARASESRERAERALREDADVADSVLDSARDAVIVVDERGFVSYANPAIEPLVGLAPALLRQTPIAALVDDALDLDHLVSSLSPGEELCDLDLSLRREGGGSVEVSASVSSLHRGGVDRGTILFLRDESRRRKVDAELARKNAELEHCVQTLAHDLRSPLVALLGFSRLLRQEFGERLDDTGTHFLDRIEQAGRTMESLIHDVLELVRIGQPGERRSLVDPRAILLQIQAELKPRLDAGRIRLLLPENPPLVYCDRTRLYQVFSNLIGNALDHMGPCEDPWISAAIVEEDTGCRVEVRDPGRGIREEHHQRIFEVFQSLGPRADGRRGTGIGLAIVKKIAETHGGRVWVDSRPGAGATFHVLFPRR